MLLQNAVRMQAMTRYLAGATENNASIEAVERHQSVLRYRPLGMQLVSGWHRVKVASCMNFAGKDVRRRCSQMRG
jgi:hypothetical protein